MKTKPFVLFNETRTAPVSGLYLTLFASDYDFFLLRRATRPLVRVLRARVPRMFARFFTTAFAAFAARRTRGLAPATFSVNAFCTDPAFAAIVPNVAPMDSATLVRMASSFAVLWLSMLKPHFSHHKLLSCVSQPAGL